MKIALTLNAHGNTELVRDTIEAIRANCTTDIAMIVDGAAWESWGEKVDLPVKKINGFIHNYPKAPYRNVTYGLAETYELFPDADWYCYSEYDVLFTSPAFKEDLKKAEEENVWCMGNDIRTYDIKLPYLERILGYKIETYKYLLGCCVFLNQKFMRKMQDENFFDKLLRGTDSFEKGYFPAYEAQGGYDFGEVLYPTLANYYGGEVRQFAVWNQFLHHWTGNFKKYPMRWQPQLSWDDNFSEACILHPIKENPLREFYKNKRNRKCTN